MVTPHTRITLLNECIALLKAADSLQQTAIGASDIACDNSARIQDLVADLQADVEDLVNRKS